MDRLRYRIGEKRRSTGSGGPNSGAGSPCPVRWESHAGAIAVQDVFQVIALGTMFVDEAHEEVDLVWQCVQRLRPASKHTDKGEARTIAERIIATLPYLPHPRDRPPRPHRMDLEGTFLAHFTSGATNGLIEMHRRLARGFRNRGNYRLRMLLIAGGLYL